MKSLVTAFALLLIASPVMAQERMTMTVLLPHEQLQAQHAAYAMPDPAKSYMGAYEDPRNKFWVEQQHSEHIAGMTQTFPDKPPVYDNAR